MRMIVALAFVLVLTFGCGGSDPGSSDGVQSPTPGSGLRYSCDGFDFDPVILEQAGNAELAADPAAAALRAHLEFGVEADFLPPSGWILVGSTTTRAEFVASAGRGKWASVTVANTGAAWRVDGWGSCSPIVELGGLSQATWTFDPAGPVPGPGSTEFTALVTERACASGNAMGDRLLSPTVVYGENEVLVIFAARPLAGGQDCPSNPSTRVLVELREPLGGRRLLDGAVYPPADPQEPRP